MDGGYGLGDVELPATELAKFRAFCPFVAQMLSDEPTTHDLEIIRRHIAACKECRVLYAKLYLNQARGGDE